jgi:HTH-type transcriptional regulator/antitoxin HipB
MIRKENPMSQSARTASQIGAIIRRARRNAGLTQAELGKRIGLRQATISKLEAGEPATRVSTLLDALTALGLEIMIDKRGKASVRDLEALF